jgi:hypothetical protein
VQNDAKLAADCSLEPNRDKGPQYLKTVVLHMITWKRLQFKVQTRTLERATIIHFVAVTSVALCQVEETPMTTYNVWKPKDGNQRLHWTGQQ